MNYWEKFSGLSEEGRKLLVNRARRQAIVLGVCACITILGVVYGLTQRIEAEHQVILSTTFQEKSTRLEAEAMSQKKRCEQAENETARWRNEFEKCRGVSKK